MSTDLDRYRDDFDDWQLEEIRLGLEDGVDISIYAKPELGFETMRQLRKGLKAGINLSSYTKLDTGVLRQLRKAMLAKVFIVEFIRLGYDAEQLEEIRLALESGVDIKPYLIPEFRGASIREIRLGLEEGLEVEHYARIELNWQQMEEIRLGLEAGLDTGSYMSMMYTPADMRAKRRAMLEAFEKETEKLTEQRTVTFLQLENAGISMSADEMLAYLQLRHQENAEYSVEEVVQFLAGKGICSGILEENIRRIIEEKNWNTPVLVARGSRPENGRDGYYEYFFRTEWPAEPPILADGSVDYANMEWFAAVEEGQTLAVYHPAEEGTCGYTVTGKELPARRGREESALSGKGFTLLQDRRTYISAVSGKAELAGQWLFVTRMCVVEEVTLATGNLNFDGCIYVKGDIGRGVTVSATEDVIIEGNVEGATIRSGKKVLLKKGMLGAGNGLVEAKKEVVGKFFESATIVSGGNILAGGGAEAVIGIETWHLGNRAGIQTRVRVGLSEKMYQRLAGLEWELVRVRKEMRVFQTAYLQLRGKYPPEVRSTMEIFVKIESAIYTKEVEIEELSRCQQELEQRERELAGASILIKGILYEGTVVEIGKLRWAASGARNVLIKRTDNRIAVYANILR